MYDGLDDITTYLIMHLPQANGTDSILLPGGT